MTQKHAPDTQHAMLGMSAARFLSDYWQQQPVVLHTPYEQTHNPLSASELAGLALEEDVEARLITQQNADWQLRHPALSSCPLTAINPASPHKLDESI
ncbi:MAG: hypothetical protein AAF529_02395 [Pseudomonadota bacterium]